MNEYIEQKFGNNTSKKLKISVLDEAWNEVLTNKIKKNLEQLEIFNESLKKIKVESLFFIYDNNYNRDYKKEFELLKKIVNDLKGLDLGLFKSDFETFLKEFQSFETEAKNFFNCSYAIQIQEGKNFLEDGLQKNQTSLYDFLFKMSSSKFSLLKAEISRLKEKQINTNEYKNGFIVKIKYKVPFTDKTEIKEILLSEKLELYDSLSQFLKKIEDLDKNFRFNNFEDKVTNSANDLREKNEINNEFDEVFYFWRKAFFDFKISDDCHQGKKNSFDQMILVFIYKLFKRSTNNKISEIIDLIGYNEIDISINHILNKEINLFCREIRLLNQSKSYLESAFSQTILESIYEKILLKFIIFVERERLIEFEGSKLLLKLIRQNLIKNKEIKFVNSSQKDNLIKNLKELNKKHEISIFKKIKLKLNDSSEISDQASINSKKIKFVFFISFLSFILLFTTACYFGININLLIKFALKKIPIDVLKKNLKIFLILLLCLIFISYINDFIFYDKFQYEQKHDQIVSNSVRDYLVNEKDDNKKFAAEFFLASLENGEFYFEPEKIQEFLKMFLTKEQIQEFCEGLKQVSGENFLETIKDEKTAFMNFIQEFFEKNILLEKPKTKISKTQGPILEITFPDWQKEMYSN